MSRGGHNKIDLTDKIFGKLIVIKDTGKRKSRRPIWLCRCECGQEVEVLGKYLLVGDTKSCGCFSKCNAHNRQGYKGLGQSYVYCVKSNAKRRGIPFNLSAEELYLKLEEQSFRCKISDVDIVLCDNYRDQYTNQTASLDRIDNSKGYTLDNVQWVHKTVNIMRNKLSIQDFLEWCNLISRNNNCE